MSWEMKMIILLRMNPCHGDGIRYTIYILRLWTKDFRLFGCHAIQKDGYNSEDQVWNPHGYNGRKISIRGKCLSELQEEYVSERNCYPESDM
jgi:hypothetical protein